MTADQCQVHSSLHVDDIVQIGYKPGVLDDFSRNDHGILCNVREKL